MAIEQKIYKTTFKLRRGQSADWTSVNPLLADGEPGFELDTGKLKIGNGLDKWNDLAYVAGPDYADTDLTNYYTKDEINNLISELNEAIDSIDIDLTGYATEEWVNSQGFLTKEDLSDIETNVENLQTTVEAIQADYVTQATVQDIVTYEVTQKMQDVDYGEITEDTEVE